MKKKQKAELRDKLRPEYDLRKLLKGSVRGKYVQRFRAGTNLVLVEPDVAEAFAHDATAINDALRLVVQLKNLPARKKLLNVKS